MNKIEKVNLDNLTERDMAILSERIIAKRLVKIEERLENIDKREEQQEEKIELLSNTMTIDYGQQQEIRNLANKKVVDLLGGKDSPAYYEGNLRSRTYSSLWRDYKDYFEINSYRNTPRKDLDKGKSFVNEWMPSGKIRREIESTRGQVRLEAVK